MNNSIKSSFRDWVKPEEWAPIWHASDECDFAKTIGSTQLISKSNIILTNFLAERMNNSQRNG